MPSSLVEKDSVIHRSGYSCDMLFKVACSECQQSSCFVEEHSPKLWLRKEYLSSSSVHVVYMGGAKVIFSFLSNCRYATQYRSDPYIIRGKDEDDPSTNMRGSFFATLCSTVLGYLFLFFH